MKKLKIAVVIPTQFSIYSSMQNLLKVYSYLIKHKNAEVTIFTDKKNNASYKPPFYERWNFTVQKINGFDYKTIIEKILFVLGIPRFYYTDLIEKLKGYDVIESSNPEFYIFAYQAYKAAKKYNSRLVLRTSQTVEGFYLFKLMRFIVVPIVRKAYNYSTYLLFTNPMARDRCVNLGLISSDSKKNLKNLIVGHATDTLAFKPLKVKKEKGKTIILSVGALYKIKGHHIIIKALKNIIDKGYKNAELWIVGEGYYKDYLMNLAKKLSVEDKVIFLGKRGHEELAKIYNKSDVFVLANYQETTPAVNEAMACEKPVVVMNCGGIDFVLPNGNLGLISKKFDAEDMADKIIFLINHKNKAKIIGKNARNHILKNFSVEKAAEKFYMAFTK